MRHVGHSVSGIEQDALQRAVAQDPSLVQQYPELASHVAKNEAEAAKELGNKAFSEKRHVLPGLPNNILPGAAHANF